ncbi:LysR family transcriptional regulator [Nocardioides bruguierae]|uniref:LysR family transcriptional regulator n=1 Tax=Nocardioides bruguierae TaxID=2945102 RepID=UPI0020211EC8|nr:LysR family transcriptional regulator [Nocardioides bruguierae]MCL8024657.1 LysR family transcriptional regulator [Nocardioides bruguierae]
MPDLHEPSDLPDLASLRLLAEVERLGGIAAAGRALGLTQQSASERLRALETRTRLTLVERRARGSALTPAGRLLVEWSHDLLVRAEEVAAAVRTLADGRSRELRVHASMTTAEHLLPRWLVRLRSQREVAASLRAVNSEQVVAAVRAGECDLGFVEGPVDLAGLASATVGHDRLVLVAAPDDRWARRRAPITPAEVAERPLTLREPGSGTRAVLEGTVAAATGRRLRSESELTSTAAVLASVRAGGAPAFVSGWAAEPAVRSGAVVLVPTEGLDLARPLRAVWAGASRPPAGPVRDLLAIATREAESPDPSVG